MATYLNSLIDISTLSIDFELNTEGLNCPLPILKTKKALANMLSGQILKLISTDKSSIPDVQMFTQHTGHQLLAQSIEGHLLIHWIRRK